MTITLTAAEHAEVLRQMPGPIYLTVEGDHEHISADCVNCRRVAPSRFVEATGPCERCGGRGELPHVHDRYCAALDCIDPCPSCEGTGRKRAELRVTCPTCVGSGAVRGGYPDYDALDCPNDCDEDGSVLFAHATIEVLPVTHNLMDPGLHVWWTGAMYLLTNGDPQYKALQLTLDPLPVPGRDWIVVLDGLMIA